MIKLENVTKQYKASTRPALSNVSLEVGKGEFAFLIGPSGSGKSTFFRMLLKEDKPTSGDIWIGEYHVNSLRARQVPKLRQSIGCVFQDFRLLQQKSVAENVAFALEVIGKPASTIGFEKRFNPMLSMTRDAFVAALTAEIPPQPADMARIVEANLRGAAPELATA